MSHSPSKYALEENEFYQEEKWCTQALLMAERPFIGGVLDPCCGYGNVLKDLEETGKYIEDIQGSDIYFKAWEKCARAAMHPMCFSESISSIACDSIITNPPFKQINELITLGLKHIRDRLCVFVPISFLAPQKNHELLYGAKSELARIWIFPKRPICIPGHLIGVDQKKKIQPAKDFVWLVFEKKHYAPATIGRLPRPVSIQKNEVTPENLNQAEAIEMFPPEEENQDVFQEVFI